MADDRLLTVAICTWNRCELLRQTLDEMTRLQQPPSVEWELIVVNNNSTDATADVLREFEQRLPLTPVFEPRPGQSNARNTAIERARGSYILWTDDDALLASNWLNEYTAAFERWPDAAFFGGPVDPWFPNTPPVWLTAAWSKLASAYAAIDIGGQPVRLTPATCPYGVNMAIRSDYQRRFPFDPERGLRPDSSMRGDETVVLHSILDSGGIGWWVPAARVRHYIPVERQTLRYVRSYYSGIGELRAQIEPHEGATLLGRPRWLWRQAVISELRYLWSRAFDPPAVWVGHLQDAATARGQLRTVHTNR